ncbi:hypothetical protein BGX26_007383, partial [Mortierella sp. AD094]
MNAKIASLHNSTPFSLFFGRPFAGLSNFSSAQPQPLSEDELINRIQYLTELVYPAIADKSQASQLRTAERFEATHHMVDFPIGSYVMIKDQEANSVFDAKYEGPFQVVQRTVRGTYVLRDAMQDILKRRYAPEQLKQAVVAPDVLSQSSTVHEVEAILSHRFFEGEWQYTVKWKGYPSSENSEVRYSEFNQKKIIN